MSSTAKIFEFSKREAVPGMRTLGIIDQIQQATRRSHRVALVSGFLIGGYIPIASYVLVHYEIQTSRWMWGLVAAALAYSALTVFDWSRIAFKHPVKAVGFVVLLEGVMTFSNTKWLSVAALVLLVTINGIATGCNLIADRRAKRKEARRRAG